MLWIFAERFFMAALRQCEKSEGCFAVFTAQPWTAAVLFKLQFSDGLLGRTFQLPLHAAFVTFQTCRNLMASEIGALDEGQGCTRNRGQRRLGDLCDAGVSRRRC